MIAKKEDNIVGSMVRLKEETYINVKIFIARKKDHKGKMLGLKSLTQYLFDMVVTNKKMQELLDEEIKMQADALKITLKPKNKHKSQS